MGTNMTTKKRSFCLIILFALVPLNSYSQALSDTNSASEAIFLDNSAVLLKQGNKEQNSDEITRRNTARDRIFSLEEIELKKDIAKKRLERERLGLTIPASPGVLNRPKPVGTIITGSAVFKDKFKDLLGIEGSVRLGNYQYELVPGELSSSVNSRTTLSRFRRDVPLRLVYFKQNKRYMITDGGLIINFEESIDKSVFASEYGLNLKYDFGSVAAFQPVPFDEIVNLMVVLKTDSRVSNVELDLIDPHLQEQ